MAGAAALAGTGAARGLGLHPIVSNVLSAARAPCSVARWGAARASNRSPPLSVLPSG